MSEANPNSRLEAFCDGVFAFALTLLIIDVRIPSTVEIKNTPDLWLAIRHILPSIFAFLLSFSVILITWVNHHNYMKLLNRSCNSFLYANGFLLLTVVLIPFPTSLQGEYVLTDHAAPAVVLFNAVLALQAIGWILIARSSLKNNLGKSEKATKKMRQNGMFGYFAFTLYTLFAIAAFWFPLTIAIITAVTWLFWLIVGNSMKNDVEN